MGKSRKRQKNGLINGSKAPQVRAAIERRAAAGHNHNEDLAAGSDNYEPPTKEPRKFQNQSSMCLIVISVLNAILKDWTVCRECRQGHLQCEIQSN